MPKLRYEKKTDGKLNLVSKVYQTDSIFGDGDINDMFLQLKANVCDLNPALVIKSITGTEQDFIMLMNRARDYVERVFPTVDVELRKRLLEMFRQCVFGYYVLTPLIVAKDVSDIKVLDYDHIVVKANGERYLADVKFFSEEDYKAWYERILRIHKLGKSEEYA